MSVPAIAALTGATKSERWGVLPRSVVGSPVAELRDGPYAISPTTGQISEPPYGKGSLGLYVANGATTLVPPSEKVDFGNEVDFFGDSVLALNEVGFHVFQTGENIHPAFGGNPNNMPNIRFEIDPNLASTPSNYSTMVWMPPPSPVVNEWSPYLDATAGGVWYLTGAAGTATGCNQGTPCSFAALMMALNDGGAVPTIISAAVGKGRDNNWTGAIDGFRINNKVYDFESEPKGTHERSPKK